MSKAGLPLTAQHVVEGWHFKRRERSDEVADPIQGEFFDEASDPDERREGPTASFVREAIQNSLDAQAENQPVHIRFFLSAEDDLAAVRTRDWFCGLWPHLRARRSIRSATKAGGTAALHGKA